MKRSSQSPHNSVPWELTNHGVKMIRSSHRRYVGIKIAELDIILADLEKEAGSSGPLAIKVN